MARENLAFLRGAVVKEPVVIRDDNGDYLYALATINVGRARRKVGDNLRYMRCDNPPIMTRDEECIKQMELWKPNDIVDVKGVISSKNIAKASHCSSCGVKNAAPGTLVFINPIHVEVIRSCETEKEALDYIVANGEISNQVFLFGTLCRDPKMIRPKKGLIVTQYQIAMNRKYRIATDPPEIKTDYPWVKSYGENAIEDHKRLHVGSEVFIDGFLQARSVNRKAICGVIYDEKGDVITDDNGVPLSQVDERGEPIGCGTKYEWKDRAMEIVPYDTEYIGDYYSDEEIEEIEEARKEQQLRDLAGDEDVDLSSITFGSA